MLLFWDMVLAQKQNYYHRGKRVLALHRGRIHSLFQPVSTPWSKAFDVSSVQPNNYLTDQFNMLLGI
jgi:hypothetical protein